jgi:signal peptidase I
MSEKSRRSGLVALMGLLFFGCVGAPVGVGFVRTFVFEPFRIPSGAMIPTLLIGDHMIAWKLDDPRRGDVVVFKYPRDRTVNFVKRVVAVGGDRIEVRADQLILNGTPIAQTEVGPVSWRDDECISHDATAFAETLDGRAYTVYRNLALPGILADAAEVTVPAGQLYVVGDNRDNSEDSRRWGFVDASDVKGVGTRIWMSWDGCAPNGGAMRPDRAGPLQ